MLASVTNKVDYDNQLITVLLRLFIAALAYILDKILFPYEYGHRYYTQKHHGNSYMARRML